MIRLTGRLTPGANNIFHLFIGTDKHYRVTNKPLEKANILQTVKVSSFAFSGHRDWRQGSSLWRNRL